MGCNNTKILVTDSVFFGHKQSKQQDDEGVVEKLLDPTEVGRKKEFRLNGKLHCLNEFGKVRPVRAVKSCIFCSQLKYPPQSFSDIGACPVDTIKTGSIYPSAPPPPSVNESIEPKIDPCPSSFIPPSSYCSSQGSDQVHQRTSSGSVQVHQFNKHRGCYETVRKQQGQKKSGKNAGWQKMSNFRRKKIQEAKVCK